MAASKEKTIAQLADSRLMALIDSLSSAVYVADIDGNVLLYNEAAAALAGRDDELRGMPFHKVLPLRIRTDLRSKPVHLLSDDVTPQHRRDLCLTTEDGATIDLDIMVRPAYISGRTDSKSRPVTDFVVVCEDITRERTLDEQRSEFISVASHELRTPIAVMEVSLSIARHSTEPMPDQIRTLLGQAHDSVMYLGNIVKDLSTLDEAANDNLPIQLEKINVQKVARNITDDFHMQAGQKGLDLTLDLDPGTPAVVSTEWHIREILQNYLTNAIKYTKKGTVTVRLSPTRTGGALFCVADTGIGLSLADQKQLFIKFFRAEDYRTRATGGTGLGLYLCQELANRIGARVWCRSKPNEGSMFYLEIPPTNQVALANTRFAEDAEAGAQDAS